MLRRTFILVISALLTGLCFAASPIATISSTQPIVVSGITIPTNRVMSWPLAVNDEVATQAAPATVRFTDGTVVTLQRNSRMRLEPGPSGTEVKMLSGSAVYDLKSRSTVSFGSTAVTTRIPASAVPAAPARAASQNENVATALAYRMPVAAPSSGVIFAPSMISTAAFASSVTRQVNSPGGQTAVILPSGLVLIVNPVMNAQGGVSGYTVVGVGAATASGSIIQTPNVTNLNGFTISVTGGQVQIAAPGQTSLLTPSQAATLLQTITTAVNNSPAVVNSGQSTAVQTNPGVTVTPFSPAAP